MALAQGLLLWLPLERLLGLRLYAPALVPDSLFVQRLLWLNRLEEKDLDPGDSGLDLLDRYIRLTTLQGELSSAAPLFISPSRLALRAIFLREPAWHRLYSDLQEDWAREFPLEALYSGIPEIQARELARLAAGVSLSPEPSDPRDLPWTEGLRQAVRSAFQSAKGEDSRLLGFALEAQGLRPLAPQQTQIGFLMARMLTRDPFTRDKVADNLSLRSEDKELAGYYAAATKPRLAAFAQFDVRAIQGLLQRNPGRVFFAEAYSDQVVGRGAVISSYLAKRAYALYQLAKAEPRLQLREPYVEQVRILAGRPAEPTLAGPVAHVLARLMLTLAHPGARAEDVDAWLADADYLFWHPSEISYDLPHLLTIIGQRQIQPGLAGKLTDRLYARGQLLSGYGNPSIFAEVQAYGLPGQNVALSLAYLQRLQKYAQPLPKRPLRTTSPEQLTGLLAAYRLEPEREQKLRQVQKNLEREYWKLYQMIAGNRQP